MPALLASHATVAVPEPVTLLGVIVPQIRPDGIVSVRLIVPVNPLTAVRVIVEAAGMPTNTGDGEPAAIVKSVTWNVVLVEWVRLPLVPVSVKT